MRVPLRVRRLISYEETVDYVVSADSVDEARDKIAVFSTTTDGPRWPDIERYNVIAAAQRDIEIFAIDKIN